MKPDEKRFCTKCGAGMDWRLGRWECAACGFIDEPPPPQAARRQGSAGGGWQGSSGSGSGQSWQAPPPPPPTASLSGGPGLYGYDSGLPSPEHSSDPLQIEKAIFMGIVGLSSLGMLILMVAGEAMLQTMGMSSGALIAGGIIGLVIQLALYYWVLFGDDAWPKWTCLGCQGLGLLGALSTMFSGVRATAADSPLGGWGVFLQLLWTGWFASIIWRDLQNKQGAY